MRRLCGCYYVANDSHFQPTTQYLPLLNSEAHTTILSTTSTTTLKQTFSNPSSTDDIKECVYTFPLYDGVSVVGFTCTIGTKTLTGLVKEKAKAKKIFDEAVAKGETAGLLEQAQEASDVFSTKLGNIPAGQSVIVDITYIGELKHHETEGIRFTVPTNIAPRYGEGPAAASSHSAYSQDGIKITVDVNMPEGSFIKNVQSPSHPIAVSMGTISTAGQADPVMSKASATLSLGTAALEKDFVLIIQSKDIGVPKALLETHPTLPNHRAIMATLVPKFTLPPSRPEIVFVADRSGSMGNGSSISMLISAMKVFLKSMPTGVKFNICSFGSNFSFLWDKSKSYTSETLEQSMAHIQTFSANMGGTETFQAIRETIERRFPDLPLEIILLTDGDIWNQNALFDYVNQQVASSEGKIRIFPLGIGNGVSHALIEGLARAGDGFATAVQVGERLDNSVVRMLRGALSPHVTNYTLEVKYEQGDDDFEVIEKVTEGMKVLLSEPVEETEMEIVAPQATISLFDTSVDPEKDEIKTKEVKIELPTIPIPKLLQAPHKIPSLYAFSRTTIYLLMSPETIQRNPTAVILRGTSTHGPLALEIPIEVLATPAQPIHQLAAKKAVQDFEEGRGWIVDAKDQAGTLIKDRFPSIFEDLVKREAVRLGEKFQVAGKWCSFVAVSDNDKEIAERRVKRAKLDVEDLEGEESSEDDGACGFMLVDDLIADSPPAPQPAPISAFGAASVNLASSSFRGTMRARRSYSPTIQSTGFEESSKGHSPRFSPVSPSYSPVSPPPQSNAQLPSAQLRFAQLQSVQPQSAPAQSLQDYQMGLMTLHQENKSRRQMFNVPVSNGGRGGGRGRGIFSSGRGMPAARVNAAPPPLAAPASTALLSSPVSPSYNNAYYQPSFDPQVSSELKAEQRKSGDDEGGRETYAPIDYTAKWANKTSAERVLGLIELQEFEGSWPIENEDIAGILGFPIPSMEGDEKAWVTLLVVLFLELKHTDEEGTWGMVVEKAREWLGSVVGGGLEDLEKAANDVVNNH